MNIAEFDDDVLVGLSPISEGTLYENREVAYSADVFIINGVHYDLSKVFDVMRIPVPAIHPSSNILELSYIMKIRCGSVSDTYILPSFVSKTLELMRGSGLLWRRRDYLQVIRNYYRCGLFEQGDSFEIAYRCANPDVFNRPEDGAHEQEHERTKQYFKKKWDRRTPHF